MKRKPIRISKTKKEKKPLVHRVPRTRNGQSETDSQHFGKIRSALRNMSRWWKPIALARKAASRTYTIGRAKRVEYQCASCSNWFNIKEIQVDHVVECGSLRSYNDLPGFCERLFAEELSAYAVLCTSCHQSKTHGSPPPKQC